jgi:hypothetical protein
MLRLLSRYHPATRFTALVGLSLLPLYFYSRSDRVPQDETALKSALVRVAWGVAGLM